MNINELRHNRYLRVLFVPFRMRALVRGSEIGLAIAGVVIGVISALAVAAIGGISQWMHQALFGLAEGAAQLRLGTEFQRLHCSTRGRHPHGHCHMGTGALA